ncbi:MAG: hypothetical protein NT051_04305, partial [Candidatus Micrarchaeota archaeon]|nr:hypothetical protein [Candidatus Micrarchaeota archaeon]
MRKFSAMIPKAKADGLDISSEEARLATLKSLLSSSTSLSTAAAVSQSANSEYSALVLRLYETFSYLEERYSYASALFSEVKKSKPQADCGLLEISRDFQAGKLNAERAAGKMLSLSSKIDECAGMAEKLVPLRLSEVLSQNSETLELYQPPILGQQTKYSATISTENPTSLSSDSKVSFNAKTTSQIYSSDQDSGDHLSDAYPDNDKTALEVSSVSAWQSFSFSFAKLILPAQKTSSRDECAFASQHEAEVVRTIGFFSSSALPSLQISEPVPSGAQSASAEFQGTSYGLEMLGGPSAETMQGEINSVPSGKSVLAITYLVRDPFSLELSSRTVESLPGGITKVSFTAKAGSFKTQCDSASATFFEPYSGISNISAVYSPGQP